MSQTQAQRALITGASSGIGLAIAHRLAEKNVSLVLTARRKDKLNALADTLRFNYGVQVEVIPADLSTAEGARELWEAASKSPLSILINNAGFGHYDRFENTPWERTRSLMQLNVLSLVELSHLFLTADPSPAQRYIVNIASVLSFTSMRYFATYAASKAFVRTFSESIRCEYSTRNVSVTCVSPGPVKSEFHSVSGTESQGLAESVKLSAEACAKLTVAAMFKRKKHVTPGFLAKIMVTAMRLAPRGLMANFSGRFLPKPG